MRTQLFFIISFDECSNNLNIKIADIHNTYIIQYIFFLVVESADANIATVMAGFVMRKILWAIINNLVSTCVFYLY
jgi:hypothetical protein